MSSDPTIPVRRFWEIWSGADHRFADIVAPGFTENGEPADVDEFRDAIRDWRAVFEGFTASIDEILVIEDRVVTRVTYRGTHVKPWGSLPATGVSFTVSPGIDIFRVSDGRITELWHSVDHLPMIRALGGRTVPATTG